MLQYAIRNYGVVTGKTELKGTENSYSLLTSHTEKALHSASCDDLSVTETIFFCVKKTRSLFYF